MLVLAVAPDFVCAPDRDDVAHRIAGSIRAEWMIKAIYPIDKTDLDMLRLTHFLALAVLVTRYFPRNWAGLTSQWLRPLILCGQAFASDFLLERVLVLWSTLDTDAVHQGRLGATRC